MDKEIEQLATKLGKVLKQQSLLLTTVESCTGGWIAKAMTANPGSSDIFERGFVTYSEISKEEMLGVNKQSLKKFGAVSKEVALEMAEGALRNSHADVSISVTGIAGPDGDGSGKAVGLVWFGFAGKKISTETVKQQFQGDRPAILEQAVTFALQHLLKKLQPT